MNKSTFSHDRCVRVDKLIERANKNLAFQMHSAEINDLICLLHYVPTADVEEVKHGEWIEKNEKVQLDLICSECRYTYIEADPDCKERFNYCPSCGAKMDGGSDDAEKEE